MKSATLRTFTTVHTWAGLLAGFALFVAFYAGALSVFHDEIDTWAVPNGNSAQADTLARADALIADLVAKHPAAKAQIGLTLPAAHPSPQVTAYWFDERGEHTQILDSPLHDPGLANFVDELHYTLGIPVIGMYLMGAVSIIYGLALLSGLLIHLPSLLRDLFALRPGHNLKRLWQDAHNVIGVLSLPFHILFAITGAMLCLTVVVMAAFNLAIFDGRLDAVSDRLTGATPALVVSGEAAPMLGVAAATTRATAVALAAGAASFEPDYMRYVHYGDRHAAVEVRGKSSRTIGEYGMVSLDAVDGSVLGIQLAGHRDANHATYAALFGLHFGSFGSVTVRWLYFVLGLAGAFLFYSGNLLYIETRRKRRQQAQPLKVRAMATATVGVCLGTCLAISVAFVANHLATAAAVDVHGSVERSCFVAFFAAIAWTLWRRPARAAVELLWSTAAVTFAVPLLDITLFAGRFVDALEQGQWAAPGLDLAATAVAVGFAWLAFATRRRVVAGDVNSVWALKKVA